MLNWLAVHGGLVAVVLAALVALNALLSGVTVALDWLESYTQAAHGVDSAIHKLTALLGKLIDFIQGNVKHD